MEKYIEVMKQISSLLETSEEALEYIYIRMSRGEYEATVNLMKDTLDAYATTVSSLQYFVEELPENQIILLQEALREGWKLISTVYGKRQWEQVKTIFTLVLQPRFQRWKAEIDYCFQPYTLL
jgi:hypothetical protein